MGCEKEDLGEVNDNQIINDSHTHHFQEISFEDFKLTTGQDPTKYLNSTYKRGDTPIITQIDTTSIKVAKLNNMTSYNFSVKTRLDTLGSFMNLVYFERKNQDIEVNLLNYTPSLNWWENEDNGYQGIIEVVTENFNYEVSIQSCSIVSIQTVTVLCTGGKHHPPGDPNCECGKTVDCLPGFMYLITEPDCPPESGGTVGGTPSTNPTDGGSGIAVGTTTGTVENGVIPNSAIVPRITRDFMIFLNQPENADYKSWWQGLNSIEAKMVLNDYFKGNNVSNEVGIKIIKFFIENGQTSESIAFAQEAIEALHGDNNLSIQDILDSTTVLSPDHPITDIDEYLDCFDLSQGAELTIYVNQPTTNSDDSYSILGGVGHAFIGISQGNITRVIGLYPEGDANPLFPEDPHEFGNNSGDPFDISISTSINSFQLNSIITEIKDYDSNYNLSTNNCSNFVLDISQLTDIPSIPDTHGNWPGGSGNNPGALGEDIRNLSIPENSNIDRNENGGNAPDNTGNC